MLSQYVLFDYLAILYTECFIRPFNFTAVMRLHGERYDLHLGENKSLRVIGGYKRHLTLKYYWDLRLSIWYLRLRRPLLATSY